MQNFGITDALYPSHCLDALREAKKRRLVRWRVELHALTIESRHKGWVGRWLSWLTFRATQLPGQARSPSATWERGREGRSPFSRRKPSGVPVDSLGLGRDERPARLRISRLLRGPNPGGCQALGALTVVLNTTARCKGLHPSRSFPDTQGRVSLPPETKKPPEFPTGRLFHWSCSRFCGG